MKNVLTAFISKFDKFDEPEIKAIEESTDVESFKKGTIIVKQGKVSNKCYFVLKGCLRQYQLINGEEKTCGFFMEGQAAVLYSSYIKKIPSEYSLTCLEDSILAVGTREQEQKLHNQHPKLEYLIHTLMLQDYTKAEERLALLNLHKPEERYRILVTTQPELFKRVPLHQIASFIGVTPESFSRIRKRYLIKEKQAN